MGILTGFIDTKSASGIAARMVYGLFLAIVVIKPITGIDYAYLDTFVEEFDFAAKEAAAMGSDMAADARREIIKTETEAYILDKASSYNLQLQVEVSLSEEDLPVPEFVCLMGSAAPYAKSCLQREIAEELDIPKERQLWIG